MTETETETTRRAGWVPESALDEVRDRLAHLNKRAARLGAPEVTLEVTSETRRTDVTSPHLRELTDLGLVERQYVVERQVVLHGEKIRASGWEFVAHADASEGLPPIVTGDHGPFGDDPMRCDHCGVNTRRVSTFAVRHEDGDVKVVGSTCVKDFLGWDPRAALIYLTIFEPGGGDDDFFEGFSSGPRVWDLVRFVGVARACARTFGWVSRTKAREEGHHGLATADDVLAYLGGDRERIKAVGQPTDDDYEFAADAVAWAETLGDEANDYLLNLYGLTQRGLVGVRGAGLAASLVAAWGREVQRRVQREARAKVPTDGKRRKVTGTITKVDHRPNPYSYGGGMIAKITVDSDDGYRLWGTCPSAIRPAAPGMRIEFHARLEPSDDDPTFGFWSRPTKAVVLPDGGVDEDGWEEDLSESELHERDGDVDARVCQGIGCVHGNAYA